MKKGRGQTSEICHSYDRHMTDDRCTITTLHMFNGRLSGTTRVSRYQKGKTNLNFTEAIDSEWQWNPLGHMQVCTSLQTDNHVSTSPLSFFTGRMPFLPPNQQRQSTEGKKRRTEVVVDNTPRSRTALTRQTSTPAGVRPAALGDRMAAAPTSSRRQASTRHASQDVRTDGQTTRKHTASCPVYRKAYA